MFHANIHTLTNSTPIPFLGKRDWYDVAPKKIDAYDDRGDKVEVGLKAKNYNDPLNVMKKYIKETEKLHSAKANAMLTIKSKTTLFPIAIEPPVHVQKHHKKKSKKSSKSKKHKKKEKSKKRSRSKSPASVSRKSDEQTQKMLRLRAERLKREEIEGNRTKLLLAKFINPETKEPKETEIETLSIRRASSTAPSVIQPVKVKQKYNSQFNPEIAKQNYEDVRRH